MDFSKIPVFDNHAHSINPAITNLSRVDFLSGYSGFKDDDSKPNGDIRDPLYGAASDELLEHFASGTAVHSTVTHLARYFGCEATVDAVLAERNRRAGEKGMQGYAWELYQNANLIAGVLETSVPIGEDIEDKFSSFTVCRLFQFDDPFFKLIDEVENFEQLRAGFEKEATEALTGPHYDGIKCHISEVYSHKNLRVVTPEEANAVFAKAKAHDKEALNTVYLALLATTMLLSQKLNAPIHIHISAGGSVAFGEPGIRGELTLKHGSMYDADPFLLMHYLHTSEFRKTKVVCLHGGFPWTREVAAMSATFPNVYVDVSLTLMMQGMGADRLFEDLLANMPHTKLMIGSGQVAFPEKAWLAAHVARKSLANVLGKAVQDGYMTDAMAQESGENILYRNATRVHRLFRPNL